MFLSLNIIENLISAFVVRCIAICTYSILPIVDLSKIPRIYLSSVAVQAGLSLIWSQSYEDSLFCNVAQIIYH